MSIVVVAGICVLIGLALELRAVRQFRAKHVMGGVFSTMSGLALILIAACAGLLVVGFDGYQRLTLERPVAQLQFRQVAPQRYDAMLSLPDGTRASYPLSGDQWQIDARMLKWQPFANVLGFDSAYRLDRLAGRYERIADEQGRDRTVHALGEPPRIDLWDFLRQRNLSWFDAYYGSATYLPMADGAKFDVTVTQSGLIARPANDAAVRAIGRWR
jgi:hypothetical protein